LRGFVVLPENPRAATSGSRYRDDIAKSRRSGTLSLAMVCEAGQVSILVRSNSQANGTSPWVA